MVTIMESSLRCSVPRTTHFKQENLSMLRKGHLRAEIVACTRKTNAYHCEKHPSVPKREPETLRLLARFSACCFQEHHREFVNAS